jgi:hypothetical protein
MTFEGATCFEDRFMSTATLRSIAALGSPAFDTWAPTIS